jgi:diguanylate cyclase (GGDEF)-like protein/PAS domain S-box-containing protein
MKYNFLLLIVLLLHSVLFAQTEKTNSIKLQLQWKYQFQFAGFIMAKELGYYKDVGLDVDILEYENTNSIQDLKDGKVDYVINNSIISYDKKTKKLDEVSLLATYFQRSPLVIIAQPEINSILDLKHKTIMMSENNRYNSSISTLFDYFSLNESNTNIIKPSFDLDDFIERRVDAITAFRSNELYILDAKKIPYTVIDPVEHGFSTNAINLFTSYKKIDSNPDEIYKFLSATKKGWKYSLEHIDEVATIIHEKYQPNRSIEHLKYEGYVTKDLMLTNLYDIGEVNEDFVLKKYNRLVKKDIILPNQNPNRLIFKNTTHHIDLSLNEEEKRYINQKGKITYCIDPDWMPFEKLERNHHIGMTADYFKLFANKLNFDFELVRTKTWGESIQFAKERKCDLFSLAMSTPKRLEYMNFTDPYITHALVVATKIHEPFIENIKNILEKPLGIVEGYAFIELLKNKYPNINIKTVKNSKDGLDKVLKGELYGFIDPLGTMAYNIQNDYLSELKIAGKFNQTWDLGVGVRNDDPTLLSMMQKIVNSITPKEHQQIKNNWLNVKIEERINYELVWRVIIVSLIVLSFLGFWIRRLKTLSRNLEFNNTRYKTMLRTTNDGFLMIDIDGNILESNNSYANFSGYSLDELSSMHLKDIEVSEDEDEIKKHLQKVISKGSDAFDTWNKKKSGELVPVDVSVSYSPIEGGRFFSFVRDRTEQFIEDELSILRADFSHITHELDKQKLLTTAINKAEKLTNSQIGFFHFVEDDQNTVSLQVWSTNTLEKMCFAKGHSTHYPISQAGVWVDCIHKNKAVIYNDYESLPHKKGLPDGHAPLKRFISVPIIRKGKIKAILGVGNKQFDYSTKDTDILEQIGHMAYGFYERLMAEERIEFLAYYDPLTSLPNRTLLTQNILQSLKEADNSDKKVAICYLDLDGFKPINDRYGHQIGDKLLKNFSDRLSKEIKDKDFIGRLGGDEFVIVLNGYDNYKQYEVEIKKLIDILDEPYQIDNYICTVYSSIGITIYPDDNSDTDTLLRHSDHAMYQAKQDRNSSYHFYDYIQEQLIKERQDIQEQISHAIDNDEFVLFYQPKIDLKTNNVTSFEALIRWQHPTRGLLFPNDFLSYIEDSVLEFKLDQWVMNHALKQLSQWHSDNLKLKCSINISPNYLEHSSFMPYLYKLVNDYDKDIISSLELEILEVSNFKNIYHTIQTMHKCKEYGIQFSLDDFGTGYSSLTHVNNLPIDILKIDQNFVKQMYDNSSSFDIVEGVLSLAKKLNQPVIAEGVEYKEIFIMLALMGCESAQGYFIAKPMPVDKIVSWIDEWNAKKDTIFINEDILELKHVDLSVAIYTHKLYMQKLNQQMQNDDISSIDEDGIEIFQRWYKNLGMARFSEHPNFAFIQATYNELRDLLKEINNYLAKKDVEKTNSLVEKLNNKSDNFIDSLIEMDTQN